MRRTKGRATFHLATSAVFAALLILSGQSRAGLTDDQILQADHEASQQTVTAEPTEIEEPGTQFSNCADQTGSAGVLCDTSKKTASRERVLIEDKIFAERFINFDGHRFYRQVKPYTNGDAASDFGKVNTNSETAIGVHNQLGIPIKSGFKFSCKAGHDCNTVCTSTDNKDIERCSKSVGWTAKSLIPSKEVYTLSFQVMFPRNFGDNSKEREGIVLHGKMGGVYGGKTLICEAGNGKECIKRKGFSVRWDYYLKKKYTNRVQVGLYSYWGRNTSEYGSSPVPNGKKGSCLLEKGRWYTLTLSVFVGGTGKGSIYATCNDTVIKTKAEDPISVPKIQLVKGGLKSNELVRQLSFGIGVGGAGSAPKEDYLVKFDNIHWKGCPRKGSAPYKCFEH